MKVIQMHMDLGELSKGKLPREKDAFIAARLSESPTGTIRLMESVCERENMRKALRRVEKNKGAPGIDGMKTTGLRGYLRRHYVEEGYTHTVDIDLAKFFGRVNHDRLMSRIAQRIEDKRILKLIRRFLNSGILIGDLTEFPGEGTPQGGPLSPLLSNIVLDELDKELKIRIVFPPIERAVDHGKPLLDLNQITLATCSCQRWLLFRDGRGGQHADCYVERYSQLLNRNTPRLTILGKWCAARLFTVCVQASCWPCP